MRKRLVAFYGTCKKFLPKPELRASCEADGHTITTAQQKLAAANGVKKRCQHPRAKWNDCKCPWYYHVGIKGQRPHRGVLGYFEHRIAAEEAYLNVRKRLHAGLSAFEEIAATSTAQSETLKSYATRWLTQLGHLKPSTRQFYEDNLENHIYPALGDVPIGNLTRARCKAFTRSLADKDLVHSTRVGIFTTLSALLTSAVDDDDCPLTVHPAAGLRKKHLRPKVEERKSKRLGKDKYFEADEVAELLATALKHFPKWHLFLLCGLRSGLRISELFGLQWGDIDWRKGFIHVQRAWVRAAWTTPKNHEDREVDLSRELRAQLWLWRRRQAAEALKNGRSRPKLVFPSTVGTPLDYNNVQKEFVTIVKKAELRHRTPHAMRHTFISLLLQRGASLAYVQKQAGHKSMDITLNTYGHFVPGGNRSAGVDLLDEQDGRRRQRGAA